MGDAAKQAGMWLAAADREASTQYLPEAVAFAAVAQVHASLAIAEQLERLNEQLEKGAIEVMYGGRTV